MEITKALTAGAGKLGEEDGDSGLVPLQSDCVFLVIIGFALFEEEKGFFFFFFFFYFFSAASMACGSSQARGQIGAAAAGLHHSRRNARAVSVIHTTAHGNAGSLTR